MSTGSLKLFNAYQWILSSTTIIKITTVDASKAGRGIKD